MIFTARGLSSTCLLRCLLAPRVCGCCSFLWAWNMFKKSLRKTRMIKMKELTLPIPTVKYANVYLTVSCRVAAEDTGRGFGGVDSFAIGPAFSPRNQPLWSRVLVFFVC